MQLNNFFYENRFLTIINLEIINNPISVGKKLWIISNRAFTSLRASWINVSSPVSTECQVDNHGQHVEVIRRAIWTDPEICHRFSPVVRVRIALSCNFGWRIFWWYTWVMSLGIWPRRNTQTLIKLLWSHSATKTPPPALLNFFPKVPLGPWMLHPWLECWSKFMD